MKTYFKKATFIFLIPVLVLQSPVETLADGNKPTPTGTEGTQQPVVQIDQSSYTQPSQSSTTNHYQTSEQSLMKGGLSPTNTPSSSTIASTPTETVTATTTSTSTDTSTTTAPWWVQLRDRLNEYLGSAKGWGLNAKTELGKIRNPQRDKTSYTRKEWKEAKENIEGVLIDIGNVGAEMDMFETKLKQSNLKTADAVQSLRYAYDKELAPLKGQMEHIQRWLKTQNETGDLTRAELLQAQVDVYNLYEKGMTAFGDILEGTKPAPLPPLANTSKPASQPAPPKQSAQNSANTQSSQDTWKQQLKELFMGSETPKKDGPVETRAASGLATLIKDEN